MRTERWHLHLHRPHMAVHSPQTMHWFNEHHAATSLMVAGLVILLIAGMTALVYRFRGAGFNSTLVHPQFPYYPYF